MADNALQPAVVDVPLGSLNALPPDHAGPTGRLMSIYDAVANHYQDGDAKRVFYEPRPGFSSFSNVLRNSTTGAIEGGTWASPSFLYALGDQLLSICSSKPRVYNGTDWTNYGDRRVVTQRLSESVLHASNNTIAAPDSAWLTGVTCSVWTEQVYNSAGVMDTTAWVGFRADDGAWVRVPTVLGEASGPAEVVMARVVQDGSHFWVFVNTGDVELPFITVIVYDTHGEQVASTTTARFWNAAPGYWDVTGSPLVGVLLAQPAAYNAVATDVHLNVKKLAYSGSITVTNADLSTAHCMGPVAWLTSDLTGTKAYLATLGPSEGEGGKLWAYEINSGVSVTQTHEYDIDESPVLLPDSMTGWAVESGVAGERDLFVVYSQLASTQTVGPTADPAFRYMRTVKQTFAGTTDRVRDTQSVIPQSRAFAINSEYYAYTYYQSGSGQLLPSAPQEVVVDEADYFIGAPEQVLQITGGGTYGAPHTFNPTFIQLKPTVGNQGPYNIDGGGTADKVESISASGLTGIPDGTAVLKWTFKNAAFNPTVGGSILKVNSSSISSANFQWDVLTNDGGGTIIYTSTVNRLGGTLSPGNFTTTGTVEIVATVYYSIPDIADVIPEETVDLFDGGSITVAGATPSGNNNTFTILSGRVLVNPDSGFMGVVNPGLFVILTTQSSYDASSAGPFTASVSAAQPNTWFFAGETFTFEDVDQGTTLVVEGSANADPTGDGRFHVTDAPGGNTLETADSDASQVLPQLFPTSPLPTVTLELIDRSLAYTMKLANVDFDDSYVNALISISNAAHDSTDGVYKVVEIISTHIVRVQATDGATNQRSEGFETFPTVVIQRGTNVQPQTQPTWFVTPLTGSQPQVGCFEAGLSYADWRFDGEASDAPDFGTQDRYRFALSSTSNLFDTTRQVVLPFRAGTFTQVSIATVGATSLDIANVSLASTVGLKVFQSTGRGEGTGDAGKLLVPGLLATEFTASGFAESNFNVGPEAPFSVSQGEDTGTNFALTPGSTYTIQAVFATTLENGDIVRSKPSTPIQFTLIGDNNYAVYGGRLPIPLDSVGAPTVADTYGLTNHRQVTIELYRSVIVNGVPSTQLHMITSPGNPNGLYAGSGTGSGFSFPDSYTWNYRDENPDAGIRATEVIYAGSLGQGVAPHFPAPAFRHATTWANRRWVVGYDGAVWMSSEIVEGEEPWFFPGLRYAFPPEDPAVCVVGFENFLFILCAKTIRRIPLSELPNATLTAGSMPTPVILPFAMGCSGFAVAMSDMVAYSSSVNGGRQIWAITRNLANVYLSEPIAGFLNQPISAMAVDGRQRLIVADSDASLRVYDPVPREWYIWRMPSNPDLVTSYLGQATYEDSGFVLQQADAAILDTRNSVTSSVLIDATLSSLSFAAVRAVKRLWEAQIIGRYNGAVNINAVIGYPDNASEPQTTFGPTLVTGDPMLLAINPSSEDESSFTIRIFGSVEGILVPGRCFSLEMLSCEVGLDPKQGIRKLPNAFRLVGSTD